jgi:hypothetical protein
MALTVEQLDPRAVLGSDGEQPAIPKILDHNPLPNGRLAPETAVADKNTEKITPGMNGHMESGQLEPYSIRLNDQLAFTPRKLRVITVGAGFSGLLIAHKFQHRFPEMQAIVDHTIYEKRHEVGGTWLVNTYPGVQCDVPSHIYVCYASFCSRNLNCQSMLS